MNWRWIICVFSLMDFGGTVFMSKKTTANGVEINCTHGDQTINILKVNIEEQDTTCGPCYISGSIEEDFKQRCHGNQTCLLSVNDEHECLSNYGYYNLSYNCKRSPLDCIFTNNTCDWYSRSSEHCKWVLGEYSYFPRAEVHYVATGGDSGSAYLLSPIIFQSTHSCLHITYLIPNNCQTESKVYINDQEYNPFVLQNEHLKPKKIDVDITQTGELNITIKGVCETCTIQLIDVKLKPGTCGVTEDYSRICLNIDALVDIDECLKPDLEINKSSFNFYKSINCNFTDNEISKMLSSPCFQESSTHCTLSLMDVFEGNADCFMGNTLSVEYECKGEQNLNLTTPHNSSDEIQIVFSTTTEDGIISLPKYAEIALVVGALIMICFVGMLVFIRLRRKRKNRKDITEHDRIGLHDYTDMQDISSLNGFNHAEHRVSNVVNNAIADKEEMGQLNKAKAFEKTESYAVSDPEETGDHRSTPDDDYDLAVPVGNENQSYQRDEVNHYAIANHDGNKAINKGYLYDGVTNVYSHSVDNVYDTAFNNKTQCRNEDNYDHFIAK